TAACLRSGAMEDFKAKLESPILDAAPSDLIADFATVTERGFPTDALERAKRLANLLTLSYEPMLAWRLDGQIEFWNAGAERLYGFAQHEAVGRTSHTLLQTEFPTDFADLRLQLEDQRDWLGKLR